MSTLIAALRRNQMEGVKVGRLPSLVILAAGIVSLVSLLMLIQTSGVASVGYDIQKLEEVRSIWREENFQLETEMAKLQALDRIERDSRTRLKMIPAGQPMFVNVNARPNDSDGHSAWPMGQLPAPAVQVEPASGPQAFLTWLASIGDGAARP